MVDTDDTGEPAGPLLASKASDVAVANAPTADDDAATTGADSAGADSAAPVPAAATLRTSDATEFPIPEIC